MPGSWLRAISAAAVLAVVSVLAAGCSSTDGNPSAAEDGAAQADTDSSGFSAPVEATVSGGDGDNSDSESAADREADSTAEQDSDDDPTASASTTCSDTTPPLVAPDELVFNRGGESGTFAVEPGQWQHFVADGNQLVTVSAAAGGPEAVAALRQTLDGSTTSGDGQVSGILPHAGEVWACVETTELTLTIVEEFAGLTWTTTTSEDPAPDGINGSIIVERVRFDGPGADVLNAEFDVIVDDAVAAWIEGATEIPAQEFPAVLDIGSRLTLVSDRYVSVGVTILDNLGAYPRWWYADIVGDRQTGSLVPIEQLLLVDRSALDELVTADVLAQPDVVDEDLDEFVEASASNQLDYAAYLLHADGLEVATGRGQWLPPVFPGTESFLTWGELDGLIDPAVIGAAGNGAGALAE